MQDRDRNDECTVEPVRHVDVPDATLCNRDEKHDGVGDPHNGNEQVDWPLEFRVLLGLGNAERQRDRCQHDDELPAQNVNAASLSKASRT